MASTAVAILLSSYIISEVGPSDAPSGEEPTKNKVLLGVLMESIQSSHFEPKSIDDEFSQGAFNLYLERLDFSKRFLLKQDVESLRAYEKQIDDQINSSDFTLFDKSWDVLQGRLKEAQGYYEEILSTPFDFSKNESLELDQERRDFASTREELKNHWRKILKYQTLTRIAEMEESQNKAKEESDTATIKTFEELSLIHI